MNFFRKINSIRYDKCMVSISVRTAATRTMRGVFVWICCLEKRLKRIFTSRTVCVPVPVKKKTIYHFLAFVFITFAFPLHSYDVGEEYEKTSAYNKTNTESYTDSNHKAKHGRRKVISKELVSIHKSKPFRVWLWIGIIVGFFMPVLSLCHYYNTRKKKFQKNE